MMDGLTDSGAKKPSIVQSAEVIKVTSNDGKSFYVNKDVLCISKRFQIMLSSGMQEQEQKVINLDLKTSVVETCLKYLHYKLIYRKVSFQRPPFHINPEDALEVLKAAIYLQC
ncbi:hypothetical protein FGO68_gene15968 [Halteria grandinella]|uniref:Elongin-C n=1 Tax=Halteria grandinella TaxID=5974 RepID=A0A8J8NEL5_HALGN|nr:hypothetical protein FGO68_gene15968 [Halteria grandinella]